jgi:hypothetical protein
MADFDTRTAEMRQELLLVAPGKAEDPLFRTLDELIGKWSGERQRIIGNLLALVAQSEKGTTDQLAAEFKSEVEKGRGLVKLIFRLELGGQKLPQWAQSWMMAALYAEDDFLNGMQRIQAIEIVGMLRSERMVLDTMTIHLTAKWQALKDQTAPFRTLQMETIDEIERIANAYLNEVETQSKILVETASRAYEKTISALESFQERIPRIPVFDFALAAAEVALNYIGINTEGARVTISEWRKQAQSAADLAIAKNDLVLARVRHYRENLRNQSFILRLFSEERRLAREYERINGVELAFLHERLATQAVTDWIASRATAMQKADAEAMRPLLLANVGLVKMAIVEADKKFRSDNVGLFLDNPRDDVLEALADIEKFGRRAANFVALDIDERIRRLAERTNEIFEGAVDEAFSDVQRLISDFPVEAREVLMLKSPAMHAEVKAVLREDLKVMTEAMARLGERFDRHAIEEAFDRSELVDEID